MGPPWGWRRWSLWWELLVAMDIKYCWVEVDGFDVWMSEGESISIDATGKFNAAPYSKRPWTDISVILLGLPEHRLNAILVCVHIHSQQVIYMPTMKETNSPRFWQPLSRSRMTLHGLLIRWFPIVGRQFCVGFMKNSIKDWGSTQIIYLPITRRTMDRQREWIRSWSTYFEDVSDSHPNETPVAGIAEFSYDNKIPKINWNIAILTLTMGLSSTGIWTTRDVKVQAVEICGYWRSPEEAKQHYVLTRDKWGHTLYPMFINPTWLFLKLATRHHLKLMCPHVSRLRSYKSAYCPYQGNKYCPKHQWKLRGGE